MSSPEKQVENNENVPSELTESKTPQPVRQGKRVPTESPYSWATPSHRKPLKQSRQPVFVADINLEQTFVEQDTIMMFQRNATFNESCDYENTSQSEPANESQKSNIFADSPSVQSFPQDVEPSDTEALPEIPELALSNSESQDSIQEDECIDAESGDAAHEQEATTEDQLIAPSLELEMDQSLRKNSCDSEASVPLSVEISEQVDGNSLAAELDAVAISQDLNVSEACDAELEKSKNEEKTCDDLESKSDETSEVAGNTSHVETLVAPSDTVIEDVNISNVEEHLEIGVEESQSSPNQCSTEGLDQVIAESDFNTEDKDKADLHSSVVGTDNADLQSSVVGTDNVDLQSSVVRTDNADLQSFVVGADNAEAIHLATELENALRDANDSQPNASFSETSDLPVEGNSLAMEFNALEQNEIVGVELESSSINQEELASSDSAGSLQVEVESEGFVDQAEIASSDSAVSLQVEVESEISSDQAELASSESATSLQVEVDMTEAEYDADMAEEESPSTLQSEIESSESATNLYSEEMDEPSNLTANSNQITTSEETFMRNLAADIANSTASTAREICSETFNVDMIVPENVHNENRRSFADISVIKPDNEANDSIGSEARDQFDENRAMQTFTTPAKGQFSDSMVEFVMLENNFSVETENELREELTRIRTAMRDQNDRIELLLNENTQLRNKLDAQGETNDVNNQTCELTQTNASLYEKNCELESIIEALRQEHNQEVENVTSKLINTTKELDSLRFDSRRNDSTIEIERAADLERLIEEMRVKNESLEKLLSEKDSLMLEMENSLRSELAVLKEQSVSDTEFLTETLQQKKLQVSSLQREIESSRVRVVECETVVDELSNILRGNADASDADNNVDQTKSFEEKCQILKSDILSLQEKNKEWKKTGSENAGLVSETQIRVEELKKELESVKVLLSTAEEEFAKEKDIHIESINNNQKCIQELEAKLASTAVELSEAQDEKTHQQDVLSAAQKECEVLREEIKTKTDQLLELQSKETSLAEQVNGLVSELKTKEDDFAEQFKQLQEEYVLKESNFTEEVNGLKSELLSKNSLTEDNEKLKLEVELKSKALLEETEALAQDINVLKEEIKNLEERCSSIEQEKLGLKTELAELESSRSNEITELKENNEKLSEELRVLRENNEQSAAVLKQKEQELAETVPKLRKELTDVTDIVVELETKLVDSLSKNSTLEEEVNKLKDDSAKQGIDYEEKMSLARDKIAELEAKLSEATVLIHDMNEKVASEKKINEEVHSEFASLKLQLEQKTELVNQNEEEVKRLVSAEEETKKKLQDSIEKTAEMEEFYEKARNEIAQLKSDLVEETNKSVTIAQEFEMFRLNFEELKETLRVKEERLKEVENTVSEATELRTELTSVKDQLLNAQTRITQFENMVQMGELELNKLIQENSSLQETIASVRAENESHLNNISQLREETSRLLSAVNDNSKLEEKNRVINTLTSEKSQLEEKLKIVAGDMQKMEDKLTTLTVNFTNEKCKTEKLVEEVNELKAERDSLKSDRDSLQADRDSLQAERNSLQADRDSLQAERNSLQAAQSTSAGGDVSVIKEELETTKRRVAELEEKCSSQDNEVERLYKMCDEFDDIESDLKQTIAEQDEEILSLKKKCGDLPQDQAGGLLDVLKQGVKPLTPNTSVSQPIACTAVPEEDEDMEEGEGFSSAPSSPTKKGVDNNVTMGTTLSSTMFKRIHNDHNLKSPAKDGNSSRCAQQ